MEKVAILGAGGFAREVLDIFMAINATRKEQQYDVVGFIDENPAIKGTILAIFFLL